MSTKPTWERTVNVEGSLTEVYRDDARAILLVVMDNELPGKPWGWRAELRGTKVGMGRAETEGAAKRAAIAAVERELGA